jgi:23S rRNA pseudouridine2605 synthase
MDWRFAAAILARAVSWATPMSRRPSPPAPLRKRKTLERVLSRAGACSRTVARSWIAQGRVRVEGRIARDPELWVDAERERILVDGKPLRAAKKLYCAFHKPKGVLTSASDPQGRRTVYDLLGDLEGWVFSVGRLDRDSSGLLLLTNDTELAERVLDPRSHLPKRYRVETSTRLTDEQLDRLRRGPELADGPTRPAKVERVRDFANRSVIEIEITEGRNRQVRRMLQAVGGRARELRRLAVGPIELGPLASGAHRALTARELAGLRSALAGRRPGGAAEIE